MSKVSSLVFLAWTALGNVTLQSSLSRSSGPLHMNLLPVHMATSPFSLCHFRFSQTIRLISYQSLLLQSCHVDSNSDFKLVANAPLTLNRFYHESGSIIAKSKNVDVQYSRFFVQESEKIEVLSSNSTVFYACLFSSKSQFPSISLYDIKHSDIHSCNFTKIAYNGAVVAVSSKLHVRVTVFKDSNSDFGGALKFDGPWLFIQNVDTERCRATYAGGAYYIQSGKVRIEQASFSHNFAPRGNSIATQIRIDLWNAYFTSRQLEEIQGLFVGKNFHFSLGQVSLMARDPTASIPCTVTRSPNPSNVPFPTEILYEDSGSFSVILIVIIVLALCIIMIGVGVIIGWKVSKRTNTIYAGETEAKDENEMGTVDIKTRYKLTDVYQMDTRSVAE